LLFITQRPEDISVFQDYVDVDPLTRLSIFMFRIWRNRPSRGARIIMIAAAILSIMVYAVEKAGLWPEHWRLNAPIVSKQLR
jgi:hypothetical protein